MDFGHCLVYNLFLNLDCAPNGLISTNETYLMATLVHPRDLRTQCSLDNLLSGSTTFWTVSSKASKPRVEPTPWKTSFDRLDIHMIRQWR